MKRCKSRAKLRKMLIESPAEKEGEKETDLWLKNSSLEQEEMNGSKSDSKEEQLG